MNEYNTILTENVESEITLLRTNYVIYQNMTARRILLILLLLYTVLTSPLANISSFRHTILRTLRKIEF